MRTRRARLSIGLTTSMALAVGVLATPAVAAGGAASGVDEPATALDVPTDEAAVVEGAKDADSYVVVLDDEPVATYDGDVPGLAATRGEKPDSNRVRRYERFLERQAERTLRRAGARSEARGEQFTQAVSGFTADLTEQEVARLREDARVLTVAPNEIRQLTTNSTPEFLGLTNRRGRDRGLWRRGVKGEDVVIGVIDSGIRPENPSFADDGSYMPLEDFEGECQEGEDRSFDGCNNKLVGAQYFHEGYFGEDSDVRDIKFEFPLEFASPLDADGHGTHTAGTAGGNQGVETEYGAISGIAPRARIAAYKVCWGYSGEGGCSTADSVAAIDQAVADGVDVINYSISGTAGDYLDPVQVAFLFAADAGVVVNASAGNGGPGAGTANHPSPWINTVAAGTEEDAFAGEVTLGNGDEYAGRPSIGSQGTEQLPLVFAGDIAAPDVPVEDAALCLADSLDEEAAAGRMVLCNRGQIARVAKSDEVARAGGAAMILANVDDNSSLNSDAHAVPSIHVDNGVRQQIAGYLEAVDDPTAALSAARVDTVVAPDPAGFSARGPIGSPDVIKPDLLAPGVDVLAAYSPRVGGRDFDFLSGTSMSSPHAAGHAALLKQLHPDWSSAAIQSAMMTSTYQFRTNGSPIPGGPFAYGSGHIDPNASANPGLVYDAEFPDWFGFLCGVGQLDSPSCADLEIDPSNLNEPNIAVGELAGTQTVTRTVTNVSERRRNFRARVRGLDGVAVSVSPSRLRLEPGETATYEVSFTTRPGAALGETTFGTLTWRQGRIEVHSSLAVTPVALAAPDEVIGSGTEGSTTYGIGFGYDGDLAAAAHGLEPATTQEATVADDPSNDINVALETGVGIETLAVDVPEGTAYTRIALFDEYTDGGDDLDLYVFGPDGTFVGGSGTGTSAEQVDIPFPTAGTYTAVVHGWQTDGPDADFTLFDWSVAADPAADDDSLTVDAPTSADLGGTAEVTASWSGLEADRKYLGAVSYADAGGVFELTLVDVQTD